MDTGATTSIISDRLVKTMDIKCTSRSAVDASGRTLRVKGETSMKVVTPAGAFVEHFLVISNFPEELLLGMTVLKRAVVDLQQGRISFTVSETEDCSHTNNTLRVVSTKFVNDRETNRRRRRTGQAHSVHLLEEVSLRGNSKNVLSIKAPKGLSEGETVTIIQQLHEKKKILVANTLTKVTKGRIKLGVINLSNDSVTLKEGTYFCESEPYNPEEAEKICSLKKKEPGEELRPITPADIDCKEEDRKEEIVSLLNKYRDTCWLDPEEGLGHYKGQGLEIKLKRDEIVNKKQYRMAHALQEKLKPEIEKMVNQGVLTKSTSSFNSPIIVVMKPDGSIRPCLDFRELNEATIPVSFPIPRIDDLLSSIHGVKVMSSLDLASAYHQCEVLPEDRHKTAFTFNNSKYEFQRVPFGLVSAPGYFSRVINTILFDCLGPECIAYMDDILLLSKDVDSHLKKLEEVLKALQTANLKLKIRKCRFLTTNIGFLGYKLTPGGMCMEPTRIKSVQDMAYPKTKKQVQAFLGALNYFRQFIPNYASIADPLYSLLRKGTRFEFKGAQMEACDILKKKLTESPILTYPNFKKTFILQVDASEVAVAACLMQENNEGTLLPIAYHSHILSDTQRKYSTTKRELLALVNSLEKFRYLILHYPVEVFTDHLPLIGLLSRTTKDACLTRWALLVQEYNIRIHYLPGKENIFADPLSRLVDIKAKCGGPPSRIGW